MATQEYRDNRFQNFNHLKRCREEDRYPSSSAKRGKFQHQQTQHTGYQQFKTETYGNRLPYRSHQGNPSFQKYSARPKYSNSNQQIRNEQFGNRFPYRSQQFNRPQIQRAPSFPKYAVTQIPTNRSVEEIVKLLLSPEKKDNGLPYRSQQTNRQQNQIGITRPIPSANPTNQSTNLRLQTEKFESKFLKKQPKVIQSLTAEVQVDVQEEWRKYKAANPPLGGFPIRVVPSKKKN